MPDPRYDPLADRRRAGDPAFDVLVHGTVFLDIVFTGLAEMPTDGTEVPAEGMGSCPGGIANLAIAASRLGLRTSLSAAFGNDDYADFCWRTLSEQEGIDLSRSRRFDDWHSPVTVSMACHGDRSMVTHAHEAPISPTEMIGRPPRARAVFVDLNSPEPIGRPGGDTWAERAAADGALLFADAGWDATGAWPRERLERLSACHAFLPNAAEAMAYTNCSTANDALYRLADLVPLAVVTNGADGAMAVDSSTGEEAHVPALRVSALDPTGAGDVFGAGMMLGTLAGWPLEHRLLFAGACAALSVQQFGGSLAAPGWGDLADWWHTVRGCRARDAYHASVVRRYGFLDDLIPSAPVHAVRRAAATIARSADFSQPDPPRPAASPAAP